MFMIEGAVNPADVRTLIIGFSSASASALQLLLRRGQRRVSILVVTDSPDQAIGASELEVPTQVAPLPCGIDRHLHPGITRVIVDIGDDEVAEQVVRIIRVRLPRTAILARAAVPDSVARLLAAGASEAFCDATIMAKLMAATALPAR